MPFQTTSGIHAFHRRWVLLPLSLIALGGCNYGFSGGGLDSNIRTIFIQPFENTTSWFDLEAELYEELSRKLPGQLGLNLGSEDNADAMLRGSITRYDDAARTQPGDAGAIQVVEHQVQIVVSVELIDRRNNVIVWDASSLTGRGEYRPDSQTDEVARQEALESILEQIVNGAQSRW